MGLDKVDLGKDIKIKHIVIDRFLMLSWNNPIQLPPYQCIPAIMFSDL